ncbi:MAG: MiaB/RimO family radical SAM methylthiotransferase [candidate division WOR-3 bacterium]
MKKDTFSSVSVINIGCRLNQAEGDQLKLLLTYLCRKQNAETGCLKTILSSDKELQIINTCAVTAQAARTSFKHIKRAIKKSNRQVVVTGCLASIAKDKLMSLSGVDAVITQDEKVRLLEDSLINLPDSRFSILPNRTRPIVKIQDGCPNECSFCIVRLIRGKPKSRPLQSILNEISHLVNLGYKEIVLTGLNLGAYGNDFPNKVSLVSLLKSLPDNSCRFRLSSIEPDTLIASSLYGLADAFYDLWTSKRLCRHLHIPLQSGDNNILKLMRRKYTVEEYCKLIDTVYTKIPDVNIGTDIIVGFPNEDNKAFENTIKIVESLPFGYLHIFPYSHRPQTPASNLPDNVPRKVKKERVNILRDISKKKATAFRNRFINRELEFLIESTAYQLCESQCLEENDKFSSQRKTTVTAISDNYIKLTLPKTLHYQPGNLYRIKIEV